MSFLWALCIPEIKTNGKNENGEGKTFLEASAENTRGGEKKRGNVGR
jgi:hypothetical protein